MSALQESETKRPFIFAFMLKDNTWTFVVIRVNYIMSVLMGNFPFHVFLQVSMDIQSHVCTIVPNY